MTAANTIENKSSNGKEFRISQRTRDRLVAAGIDLSKGYPYYPTKPASLDAAKAHAKPFEYTDAAGRAASLSPLTDDAELEDLTPHIGTEIRGLQLARLTNAQRDALALLVAQRGVVFLRDQEITPQEQLKLGEYWGKVHHHPSGAVLPGLPGVQTISDELLREHGEVVDFRNPCSEQEWHTSLGHEPQPPGYTHLHYDSTPPTGGDTTFSSGYVAYDKLSPPLQAFVDTLEGLYRSAHVYTNPANPDGLKVPIVTAHPLVRTHPVTGWKSLFVNRRYMVGIKGLSAADSDALLEHLWRTYETAFEGQVRFRWTPGTSAIWDARSTIDSTASDTVDDTTGQHRHATRVTTLAEVPIPASAGKSRRVALGLDPGVVQEQGRVKYY